MIHTEHFISKGGPFNIPLECMPGPWRCQVVPHFKERTNRGEAPEGNTPLMWISVFNMQSWVSSARELFRLIFRPVP